MADTDYNALEGKGHSFTGGSFVMSAPMIQVVDSVPVGSAANPTICADMTEAEGYRRRADRAELRARECRGKIRSRPESRAAYEMQHDGTVAEMHFYDAAARAATHEDARQEMGRFASRIIEEGVSSSAIDRVLFLDHLKRLVAEYL